MVETTQQIPTPAWGGDAVFFNGDGSIAWAGYLPPNTPLYVTKTDCETTEMFSAAYYTDDGEPQPADPDFGWGGVSGPGPSTTTVVACP